MKKLALVLVAMYALTAVAFAHDEAAPAGEQPAAAAAGHEDAAAAGEKHEDGAKKHEKKHKKGGKKAH